MQARGGVFVTCTYAYLRVILKHNLSEYNRRMKWDWLRFFITRRCRILELLPLTIWLYAPHPVSNRPPGGPRYFQKRNSPGSSVSVDTTSCQKLRQNKQMTPISSLAGFLFPSDRVQLNESKTKLPQRAILIVRITLMPVHFCNY